MIIRCKRCDKEFEKGNRKNRVFCSYTCKNRYCSQNYLKKGGIAWQKKYPEKYNQLIKKSYYKNKSKWISRMMTLNLFSLENRQCFLCKNDNDLQIHHEIYPTTIKEIKQAISNNKIYIVCKSCHNKIHKRGKL